MKKVLKAFFHFIIVLTVLFVFSFLSALALRSWWNPVLRKTNTAKIPVNFIGYGNDDPYIRTLTKINHNPDWKAPYYYSQCPSGEYRKLYNEFGFVELTFLSSRIGNNCFVKYKRSFNNKETVYLCRVPKTAGEGTVYGFKDSLCEKKQIIPREDILLSPLDYKETIKLLDFIITS